MGSWNSLPCHALFDCRRMYAMRNSPSRLTSENLNIKRKSIPLQNPETGDVLGHQRNVLVRQPHRVRERLLRIEASEDTFCLRDVIMNTP